MSDLPIAVQKAVKSALDTALGTVSVYDRVPQKTAYPYVTIDGQEATATDALAKNRDEIYLYISVWSRYAGSKEVLQLTQQIRTALHQQRLALDTGRMVRATVIRRRNRQEPDGLTFMGSITVKIIAEH